MTCAHCGSRQGRQANSDHVRHLTCIVCERPFEQRGPGRTRLTCGDPKCAAARHNWTERQITALNAWEG